ncbi:hypothetical protein [Hymenobacter fodinae]|uniref:Uncharacterized protein n=1 Tax=Hymenobacter fodinae TaxID=2510796 RepID=A0A4Z0P112_9BACT|nr:hypothetical protein [Hymenobacter fodinae]TGE03354.1 hypothetical protein EU556_25910 [Hymenobacter fodinae]
MSTSTTSSQCSNSSAARIVRLLYWDLLALQQTTPYRSARLRRIADQMQYAVQHWPAQTWPQFSPQGYPIPEQVRVIADLADLPSVLVTQHQYLLVLARSLR